MQTLLANPHIQNIFFKAGKEIMVCLAAANSQVTLEMMKACFIFGAKHLL